jgi:type 1 glutamine amidotransferase
VHVLRELGRANGLFVDDTDDPAAFTPQNLARYRAVVWQSVTGDVLDPDQQAAFEAYVEGGGGFAGVHAAGHAEIDWPWYGELVGARFDGTDQQVQPAVLHVEDHQHPSTAMLPATWDRTDEWYDFTPDPRDHVHVLVTIDEATFHGGTMGADHPIAWCHDVAQGRSWYTAGGHTKQAYDDPLFQQHLLHGVLWAAGMEPGSCDVVGPPAG